MPDLKLTLGRHKRLRAWRRLAEAAFHLLDVFPPQAREGISRFRENGAHILLSGAHMARDLFHRAERVGLGCVNDALFDGFSTAFTNL